MEKNNAYNERLFSKKNLIRYFFHTSRFIYIRECIKRFKIQYSRVIELGCFDGKLIEYLPLKPLIYNGFDANWEGGLDKAKEKQEKGINFHYATSPKDIKLIDDNKYNLGICMETFEHMPPHMLCPYLKKLSSLIDGYFLITVPNEKGIFFLLKYIIKPKNDDPGIVIYSLKDILNLTLGRTNYVNRNEHKGFDYDHLIYDVRKYFDIVAIEGYPKIKFIPKFLSFGIAIVAKTKKII
tara:strand:+ start:824 stop:1537 length:714 start_codon:yes stop_codon:yes gene_type:complete